jgi:hypothetical protein
MDELQQLWKAEQDSLIDKKPKPPDLHQEPTSIIEKMKKRLKHEDRANYLIGILLVAYFLNEGWYVLGGIIVAFLIPVFWYYRYLIRELKFDAFSMDVLHFLSKTSRMLSAFVLHYRIFGYVVVPLGFVGGIISGLLEDNDPAADMLSPELIIISAVCLVLLMMLMELYIWLMYGKLMKKLKALIKDLDAE